MRMKLVPSILGLCFLTQGCGPIAYAIRTVVIEPIHYCRTGDDILEQRRNYKLADKAWDAIAKAESGHSFSPDYVHGFKDGFADYLYAGGSGDPPPLPPRHYWKRRYETPQGHQSIEDWFAGFRLGATLARESGYRAWVTIPSSLPLAADPQPIAPERMAMPAAESVLPPPKRISLP